MNDSDSSPRVALGGDGLIYNSELNDPTKWEAAPLDILPFKFASNADAKECAVYCNNLLDEIARLNRIIAHMDARPVLETPE